MKNTILRFLICITLITTSTLVIAQERDICHYSNYPSLIFQCIFENDLDCVVSLVESNDKELTLVIGNDLLLSPLEYAIMLNKNKITVYLLEEMYKDEKEMLDALEEHAKTAVISGNAFTLKKILAKSSNKISLAKYHDQLITSLISYDFAKNYPEEKSICFKAISESSIVAVVKIYFDTYLASSNYSAIDRLYLSLIEDCPQFFSR
ncbi:MAG: hypothetical protein AB8G15_08210 [Saprospiraceae bacterium]